MFSSLPTLRASGKSNIQWPGLNAPVVQGREIVPIAERPPDPMREQKLLEVRNRLDRFRRLSIPPNERGFTGGSPAGKSLGTPEPIDESAWTKTSSLHFHFVLLQSLSPISIRVWSNLKLFNEPSEKLDEKNSLRPSSPLAMAKDLSVMAKH